MKRRAALTTLAGAVLSGCLPLVSTGEKQAYLFAYFTGNGGDGLHLAASSDGYQWEALRGGASFLVPSVGKSKLMRDPSLVRGPDGLFHMVWTSGWNDQGIGYASSPDLLHWSPQRALPVMAHEPGALNAWAPEIFYDRQRGHYLILWSSTIPGRFPETDGQSEEKYNHRIYATTAQDFNSFTPTRLYYDPGFSVIDATLTHAFGRDWLLVKDETRHPPKKHLRVAPAARFDGPFGALGAPITPSGLWSEGPSVLQVGDEVIVYYDAYTAGHYGAMRTRDMVNWEDVTAKLRFPGAGTKQRVRHGTAFAVPSALVERLR
ncbi:glycoside hydrolase family 43 protein [Massilia sp. 9I]|uniref:glycoside hydrolase family 43 protein n=1 Tax=Massilia sp. 9I TaxID=2653152 RepID=UPI0012F2B449|nr:glycoside hydrolase family 43 protein [Massilia sp. 9I]VXA97187.1 Beta-xylosidase [Massilia sp. 9I]